MELNNLEELLIPKLGKKTVKNVDITKTPTQGFGSTMLRAKVTVQDENNQEEILHLVAKKIPASEEMRESFDIQKTFKKEAAFYEVIVPTLNEFQKEEGVTDVLDNFARFYGVRFSIEGKTEVVDEDGVILMEDLFVNGFKNGDRQQGFDLNFAEKILQDLARFHGTVIALKFKKPDVFKKKVRPLCTAFKFPVDDYTKGISRVVRQLIEDHSEDSHLAEKASNFPKQTPTTCREPFGTIIHFDLWVNNIMNKIEEDGSIKNVFVDFQVYDYRSPAADVFFFLWTSVKTSILKQNLNHLLTHYHEHLVNTLNSFNVDISFFDYKSFEEELRIEAEFEFGHALMFKFMLVFLAELDPEVDVSNIEVHQISPELKEIIYFMVSECAKRGWLY